MYDYFQKIASFKSNNGVIDYDEFCVVIGVGYEMGNAVSNSMIVKNMFTMFDTNGDEKINFREFLVAFSIF